MASRNYDNLQTLGKGIKLIVGSFTTDGAGAVSSQVDPGTGFTVSKPGATTGVYRVTFGTSATQTDQYPQAFYAAFATLEKSAASGYLLQVENAQVSTAGAPYVDILVKNLTSAVTPTSGDEWFDAIQFQGLYPHLDGAAGVSTADATSLATSKTLAKAIADYLAAHDDNTSLHTAADAGALTCAAYASSPAEPNDLAEVNAMAREMATDWYTHAQKVPAVHPGYDVAAIIPLTSQPANTDQDGTNALLNTLKAAINQSVRSDYPSVMNYVKSATVATTGAAAADLVSCTVTFGIVVSNSTCNSITG